MTGLVRSLVALALLCGPPQEARLPTYDFHDVFWTNLHHHLYVQALDRDRGNALASDEEAWVEAVAYYAEELVSRDLLFDEGMRRIDAVLGEAAGRRDLEGVELEGELAFVLESVAPLYRERFWDEHREANEEWLARMRPVLDEHLPAVAARLARIFQAEWPQAPIRVDVLYYANWAGAYTSDDPDHIRIGTRLPDRLSTPAAFEIFAHESAHLIMRTVLEGIRAKARELGARPPRDLWHMLLFYTVGEVVRGSGAVPDDYEPYAFARGLYRGRNAPSLEAIEAAWPPYLAGEIDLDEALARLVAPFVPAARASGR